MHFKHHFFWNVENARVRTPPNVEFSTFFFWRVPLITCHLYHEKTIQFLFLLKNCIIHCEEKDNGGQCYPKCFSGTTHIEVDVLDISVLFLVPPQNKSLVEGIKEASNLLNNSLIVIFSIFGIFLVLLSLSMLVRNQRSSSDREYTCHE